MMSKRDYENALIPLKEAASLNMYDKEGLEKLGECYFRLKKFILRQESATKPIEFISIENILGETGSPVKHILRSFALFKEGRYEESVKEADAGLEVCSWTSDINLMAGLANLFVGKYEKSVALLEKGIPKEEYSWETPGFNRGVGYFLQGLAYFNTGQTALAEANFKKAKEKIPGIKVDVNYIFHDRGISIPKEFWGDF